MIGRVRYARRAALAGALAVIVAACGGASGSAAPPSSSGAASPVPATPAATTSQAPAPASAATGGTGNAISALADLASYKLKMTMSSKGVSGGFGSMGDIAMEGTVIAKPAPASDIKMTLGGATFRTVEVNGKTYLDLGDGSLTESTDSGTSSTADSLSPEKLLGSTAAYLSLMKVQGDEQKNGIATTHYTADDQALAAAASGLELLGLSDANWTWDVWIAKDGGYAVSYVLKGTGSSDSQLSITLDVSDVNSPSNVVAGP